MNNSLSRNRVIESIYYGSFMAVGLFGLFTPGTYNILPAGYIFEGVLLLTACLIWRAPKKSVLFFFLASMAYVCGALFLMVNYQPSNLLDFAQSYKAFMYIAPLCMFYGRGIFDRRRAVRFLKFILVLFALKYAYSVALNINPRMGTRPGLYVENNFELIFLIIAFYALHRDLGRSIYGWFALLVGVVVISGSRSSVLALLVIFVGMFMTKVSFRTFFYSIGLAGLFAVASMMFISRASGGLQEVDRYKFMLIFVSEVQGWPVWKFFVGSFPITPLSPESCGALASYENLFSFSGDGTCYSVILHSYFMRVVYDQGLLGLAFLFGFIAYALSRSGYDRKAVAVVLGVISASALSVSAVNSVFVSLAIALVLGLQARDEGEDKHSSESNFYRPGVVFASK